MSVEDRVKSLAREVGFHAVGITTVTPGDGFSEAHPNARSIISVALSYLSDQPDRTDQSDAPRGWLARFARGLDYHPVMQSRLFALSQALRAEFGKQTEIHQYADTHSMSDRATAIRARVGSPGKNSCVYVGEYGSWVALGELVTDLELEPDVHAPKNICGECDLCIRACPTSAITEPGRVDVQRCLSAVTQRKDSIPLELREKLGTRIYGCDTCQSVCPLNKCAIPGNVDEFHPSRGLGASPELLPLLNITPSEFKERVAPTTAGWIRRNRFRRNVAVALGNIGDPSAVPALTEASADPDPVLRDHVLWALARICG